MPNPRTAKQQRLISSAKSVFIWIVSEGAAFLILQPVLQNSTDMMSPAFITNILGILLTLALIAYLSYKWYRWHQEDEKLIKEDLLKIIKELHLTQASLSVQGQTGNQEEVQRCVRKINSLVSKLEKHQSSDIVELLRAEQTLHIQQN